MQIVKKPWNNWISKRFQLHGQKTLEQKDVLIFVWRQGILYLVLILITFIAGVNYANNLILGFCFLISAILCVSFYLTFKQLHGLQMDISTDEVGQAGHLLTLNIHFRQAASQPRYLWIETADQLEKILITEKVQHFVLHFKAEQRGLFRYPRIKIFSVYPFGLVRAWTYLYLQSEAWIAPSSSVYLAENKRHQHSFLQDMDEFRELRSFQDGDSLHAVSWKQAARGQGLYIKIFEQFQDLQRVEIHYSAMPAFAHEEKLSLMMGLIEQCEHLQQQYSVHLPGQELVAGCGEKQLLHAKKLLAQA